MADVTVDRGKTEGSEAGEANGAVFIFFGFVLFAIAGALCIGSYYIAEALWN